MPIISCASFETRLGTNIDTEANTYELAIGYRSEGTFNVLAFGNLGFLMENPAHSFVYTLGLGYEHYFTNVVGISARFGYRHKRSSLYRGGPRSTNSGFLMQLGVPFSWTYGKITPYVGVTFYETPRMNFGISLALRNEAAGLFLFGLFYILGALGAAENEESVSDSNRFNVHVHWRDPADGSTGVERYVVHAKTRFEAETMGLQRFRLLYPNREITRVRTTR